MEATDWEYASIYKYYKMYDISVIETYFLYIILFKNIKNSIF